MHRLAARLVAATLLPLALVACGGEDPATDDAEAPAASTGQLAASSDGQSATSTDGQSATSTDGQSATSSDGQSAAVPATTAEQTTSVEEGLPAAIDVATALGLADGTSTAVAGGLVADGATTVLCDALTRSLPPKCVGDPLPVAGLDLATVPGTQVDFGVTWAGFVTIEGTIRGGRLEDATATGAAG